MTAPPRQSDDLAIENATLRQRVAELEAELQVLLAQRRADASDGELPEERYRNFVRNATEGIYRIDFVPPVPLDLPERELVERLGRNAFVGEVNEHLAHMYGLSVSDMVGRRATDFAPTYGERALLAIRAPHFQVRDQETVDVNPAGEKVFLLENFTGVVEGERLIHIWGMQRDITERKRAEEEKEKLHAQLVQAQKMESVGRLAGGVAHDFNNMLGAILGHTELAMASVDPAGPLFADLEGIRKAAARSADLTRQLLAFARKQTIAPQVLDLNETVDGMLKMLRRLIGEDIQLAWLPGQDTGLVRVDPSQVDQILVNLCVNARDAIAGTGRLTIETHSASFDEDYCTLHAGFVPGEYVLLAVSDDGCGMDAETRSHLFEPFFTTKAVGTGTGLGLAMVFGIVTQNTGFINVYSEPGRGTTFRIYLPRYRSGGAVPVATEAASTEPGRETILLVEDEPTIREVTRRMLRRLGYTVMVATAPGEAIRLAREHTGPIDLLLTDVVMPGMNGRDLARNLSSLHPGMERVFMSGYTANVIAHHGVLDEGVHFLQKPFSAAVLAAKLRDVLGRRS